MYQLSEIKELLLFYETLKKFNSHILNYNSAAKESSASNRFIVKLTGAILFFLIFDNNKRNWLYHSIMIENCTLLQRNYYFGFLFLAIFFF